jgi:hypothetical protein
MTGNPTTPPSMAFEPEDLNPNLAISSIFSSQTYVGQIEIHSEFRNKCKCCKKLLYPTPGNRYIMHRWQRPETAWDKIIFCGNHNSPTIKSQNAKTSTCKSNDSVSQKDYANDNIRMKVKNIPEWMARQPLHNKTAYAMQHEAQLQSFWNIQSVWKTMQYLPSTSPSTHFQEYPQISPAFGRTESVPLCLSLYIYF